MINHKVSKNALIHVLDLGICILPCFVEFGFESLRISKIWFYTDIYSQSIDSNNDFLEFKNLAQFSM